MRRINHGVAHVRLRRVCDRNYIVQAVAAFVVDGARRNRSAISFHISLPGVPVNDLCIQALITYNAVDHPGPQNRA